MEGFTCKLKTKTVTDWIRENKDDPSCPPCLIPPLASYYLGALEKAGEKELAAQLKKVFEDGSLLTTCQELDRIKSEGGEALGKELIDLDCFAQSYKPDAVSKQA